MGRPCEQERAVDCGLRQNIAARLARVPVRPPSGRAVALEVKDLEPTGSGDRGLRNGERLRSPVQWLYSARDPIVVGINGQELWPDLFPKAGWGTSELVYVPSGTAILAGPRLPD